MYPLLDYGFASYSNVFPTPMTDDIIFGSAYFKNLPETIEWNGDVIRPAFIPGPKTSTLLSYDEQGVYRNTGTQAVSKNGRWIVVDFERLGYVRFDTSDMSVKWLAPSQNLSKYLAVNNDGVVMASVNHRGYNVAGVFAAVDCGEDANALKSDWFVNPPASSCNFRSFSEEINRAFSSNAYESVSRPEFSEDGMSITMFVRPDGTGGEGIIVTISEDTAPKLDYLALGDSYSSGEGDTGVPENDQSYYTHQSRGQGGCHISTRSYPFLLKQFYEVDDERMKSVACSGARMAKDYYGPSETYYGQGGQLSGLFGAELITSRTTAISTFAPGIVKQLEFIKTNKPKVVTITGGGNDIGFRNVITNCITRAGIGSKTSTCEEAVVGSTKRALLGDAIKSQYEEAINLIKAVKEVSPSTSIYVVGYPSFLADGAKQCANAPMLNQQEREGINEGVTYLNSILAQASKSAGANYIDIERSLVGGRICEGSEYMTGALSYFDGVDFAQMFHPNSQGHMQMAAAIQATDFKVDSGNNPHEVDVESPAKPASFGTDAYIPTYQENLLSDAAVIPGKVFKITLPPGRFLHVRGPIKFTLYSNPVDLGAYETSDDGSLSVDLKIPTKTPLGMHMLVMDVTSPNVEHKRYYQYVEVRSADANDRDGDKISDDKDACLYILHWYDEMTGEDICKKKAKSQLPGKGRGYGYGHLYSNGLHLGHGGHDSPFVID